MLLSNSCFFKLSSADFSAFFFSAAGGYSSFFLTGVCFCDGCSFLLELWFDGARGGIPLLSFNFLSFFYFGLVFEGDINGDFGGVLTFNPKCVSLYILSTSSLI